MAGGHHRSRRQRQLRARPQEQPQVLSLSFGNHGLAQRPDGDARPRLEPAFIYWIQPDLQRGRSFYHGDAALFRRRPLHDHGYLFMGATVVLYPPPYGRKASQGRERQRITGLFLVRPCCAGCSRYRAAVPLLPGRASADLRRARASIRTSGDDHARSCRRTCSSSTLDRRRRHFGAAPEHPERPRVRSAGRVRRRGRDRRRGPPTGSLRQDRPRCAIAAAASPRYYRPATAPRSATAGTIRATSARSTRRLHLSHGRQKDMIIRGGVNIFRATSSRRCCRDRLRQRGRRGRHAVARARRGGRRLRRGGASAPTSDLIAICRAALAPYKVPRRIFVLDELLRGLGKVLKRRWSSGCGSWHRAGGATRSLPSPRWGEGDRVGRPLGGHLTTQTIPVLLKVLNPQTGCSSRASPSRRPTA